MQAQHELDRAVELFRWNQRLMSGLGLWPENRNNLLFFISYGYFSFLMILEYLDLFNFIDNTEQVVMNFTENVAFMQIFFRITMLWVYNDKIGEVIAEAKKDFDPSNYKNVDEREAFIVYNSRSRTFVKLLVIFVIFTASTYYLTPILAQLGSGMPVIEVAENETRVLYILPYRFHVFYVMDDIRTYFLTYAALLPFPFVSGCGQAATDCIMVTLVYHICGQMSTLATRLKNLDTDPCTFRKELQIIIEKHDKLLRMGKTLQEAFSLTLLAHLIGATTNFCMVGYQILLNLDNGEKAVLIRYLEFQFLILLILYAHCTVGESLLTESVNIREAFYCCKWYDMPAETARYVIFSIGREQKPLCLSAGKFGMFCLNTLTEVVKTSMGYLSVLRTLL